MVSHALFTLCAVFFICSWAAPWPTLGHYQMEQPHSPNVNH